jgi:hypothetical protein
MGAGVHRSDAYAARKVSGGKDKRVGVVEIGFNLAKSEGVDIHSRRDGVACMKARRFTTDLRLWEGITLAVLAASWCIPVISIKSGPYFSIARPLWELVVAVHRHDDPKAELFRGVFIVFGSTSVVVAIVLGWLLHCLVGIVSARKQART